MIAAGHPPAEVFGYTVKQARAFGELAARRQTREAAQKLSITTSGSRGDPKKVAKMVRDWSNV